MKRITTSLLVIAILTLVSYRVEAQTYTLKVLHSFTGPPDGAYPAAGLVLDADGNLYGTTLQGGNTNCPGWSADTCGIVFKISPNGTETILHAFTGIPDGASPQSTLVRDEKGNLYGTTVVGGTGSSQHNCYDFGTLYDCGTVFKIDPTGKETILHNFTGFPDDGAYPLAGLRRDKAGNLYGTTRYGGLNTCTISNFGCGIIFKIDLIAGSETVLFNFTGWSDGEYPYSRLIVDGTGNLYGTASGGGIDGPNSLFGTVFKLAANSTGYAMTTLYSFTGSPDGATPEAGVVLDTEGNIYGTTSGGGKYIRRCGNYCGIVFKLDTTGKETVLHSFGANRTDGSQPNGDLVRDKKGNLYGTTYYGGIGPGMIFKISSTGRETILHNFTGTDGANPYGLIQDGKGNFYGTTYYGGDSNCDSSGSGCGTVFKLILDSDGK